MTAGVPYPEALQRLAAGRADRSAPPALEGTAVQQLLQDHHPDYRPEAQTELPVGPSRGVPAPRGLAQLLCRPALIHEADLEGLPVEETEVLVLGSGGAGAAAALTAAHSGASVVLATKLALGDSNTVMAESGMQTALQPDDPLQTHFDDSYEAGHRRALPEMLARMVESGPETVRWLIELGFRFDREGPEASADISARRAGGTSRPRLIGHGDQTGLELMKVLREALRLQPGLTVRARTPAIELLSDEHGRCQGAVLLDLDRKRLRLLRSRATILATGGLGRLHLHDFPTSNHFGATGDGLVLAYRMGVPLRDISSLQFHPTGLAWPPHLAGMLVPESARSAGVKLVNGQGERFVEELAPRDVVASAVLREIERGWGVERDGTLGVFLDLPGWLEQQPRALDRFPALAHLAGKCGLDPTHSPLLIRPTLHYQNGGLAIESDGSTRVPGLFCAGEAAGGIHGHNRLAGNALLDILVFGRISGARAAAEASLPRPGRASVNHLIRWERELTKAGLPLSGPRAPELFPDYANFALDSFLGRSSRSGVLG